MAYELFKNLTKNDIVFVHDFRSGIVYSNIVGITDIIPTAKHIEFDDESYICYGGSDDSTIYIDRFDKNVIYTTIPDFEKVIKVIYNAGVNNLMDRLQKFIQVNGDLQV